MTKEKRFVFDPPSSLSLPLYPSPAVTSIRKLWKDTLCACICLKYGRILVFIYAVYPQPLLNHQTLILPITSVSVISNSTSQYRCSTLITLRSTKYSLVMARIGEIKINCKKPDLYRILKKIFNFKTKHEMSNLQLHNFLSLYMCQSQNLIKVRKNPNSNGFHLLQPLCIVLLKLFLLLCFS